MLNILKWCDSALARLETWVLIILTGLLAGLLITQVVLRYIFGTPLFWAEEVALQILVAISFIGVSHLLYTRSLVRIDIIPSLLPERAAHCLEVFFCLLGLCVLAIFTALTWQWIASPHTQIELSPTTQLPRWYYFSVMLVALMVMSYHQFVSLLLSIHRLVSHEASERVCT
mgnify:FL=1